MTTRERARTPGARPRPVLVPKTEQMRLWREAKVGDQVPVGRTMGVVIGKHEDLIWLRLEAPGRPTAFYTEQRALDDRMRRDPSAKFGPSRHATLDRWIPDGR